MTATAETGYQRSGEEASEATTERRRQVSLAGLITTTVFPPPDVGVVPVDITTIPASLIEASHYSAIELAENDFNLGVVAAAYTSMDLAVALTVMLSSEPRREGEDPFDF